MPKAKTTSETTKKPRKAAAKARPTHDDIAARAYEIYQERGYTPGDPMQDWLQAERELNAAAGKPKKAARKPKVVSIAA